MFNEIFNPVKNRIILETFVKQCLHKKERTK